jgi:hypothetical protein
MTGQMCTQAAGAACDCWLGWGVCNTLFSKQLVDHGLQHARWHRCSWLVQSRLLVVVSIWLVRCGTQLCRHTVSYFLTSSRYT